MNVIGLAEKGYLPDWLIRVGIRRLLAGRLQQERRRNASAQHMEEFLQLLKRSPVALATEQANAQHYERPAAFFETVLGPRLKYSCCYYADKSTTLQEAEEAMLRLTCERADLEDGMDVLDLGCGWGSLSLWVAEHFPHCRVTALSNSTGQRRFIESRAAALGLQNLRVITANIADDLGAETYDRIISVEMFEHMRNYETLLHRIASWLRPEGKLFVHMFCHCKMAYLFNTTGKNDWMARHFFTDGLMPSFDLLDHFDRDLVVRRRWQVNGQHYARTCEDWLKNLDINRDRLLVLFAQTTDCDTTPVMLQRWRIFFMACAELFGTNGGSEWFVGHYLLQPRPAATALDADLATTRTEAIAFAQDGAIQ
ncbi:SAM-dependent methyltransferase [Tautonia sociabilis]|uniref:Class I SAM-dependent methyltransferase n=1 Tax=Tautonia sociabilis TaxID=2080755 RepID=A0A432MF84_9BACT|nr:cyclopropane-fatty-acyl-phospholipid synthase family protein [Tautonia sociabilis]RUL84637.1 class I SAM-dependent methyltransferase [Tautonia sociabilis]